MLEWKGKECHFAFFFHHVVNAGFMVWRRGQLFYRRAKGQGLKPPLMSMCARPCLYVPFGWSIWLLSNFVSVQTAAVHTEPRVSPAETPTSSKQRAAKGRKAAPVPGCPTEPPLLKLKLLRRTGGARTVSVL